MFSKTAIFAISAMATTAYGTLTATFTGCPTACPEYYVQSSGCECCPVETQECDTTKYNGIFCYGSGTDIKLDINSIPLSCPQR